MSGKKVLESVMLGKTDAGMLCLLDMFVAYVLLSLYSISAQPHTLLSGYRTHRSAQCTL